ncbi:hypothetical protein BCR42DRAFT_495969 [Absidia repens]|uniref:Uncharacterized protein n=1 Tax=Absidia repens TaxID=90262 RepID=A0A1X2I359_9FUNG|nr:hypothetical protein BCR42DRAFT_495969 [Absidia repens]
MSAINRKEKKTVWPRRAQPIEKAIETFTDSWLVFFCIPLDSTNHLQFDHLDSIEKNTRRTVDIHSTDSAIHLPLHIVVFVICHHPRISSTRLSITTQQLYRVTHQHTLTLAIFHLVVMRGAGFRLDEGCSFDTEGGGGTDGKCNAFGGGSSVDVSGYINVF